MVYSVSCITVKGTQNCPVKSTGTKSKNHVHILNNFVYISMHRYIAVIVTFDLKFKYLQVSSAHIIIYSSLKCG